MLNITLSNVPYYQAILEETFLSYLAKQGASERTRKNYRCDMLHFIRWTIMTIQNYQLPPPSSHQELLGYITPEFLSDYRQCLRKNGIPTATINRRLSTIRTFFRCCLSHGWIQKNPAESLSNVLLKVEEATTDEMLAQFSQDLAREGASKVTIRNYLSDARKFLFWLERQSARKTASYSSKKRA